jgi:ribonuclease BN (tRNA processing enzyme)
MNKKYIDYIIYGVLGIVFIFSLILIFSSDKTSTSNNTNTKVNEELVLDTPTLTVKVGEEMELTAHVNNNDNAAITYLSLNTDIATIDENHVVKGINTGRTYIMVRYHDNNGTDQIKHCSVDVLTNENYEIERISMVDGDIVIKVGHSYKLEYQGTPESYNYKNEYLVTDNTIISIDKDGNLKGLKEGTATITIIDSLNKVTTTVKVNVIKQEVATKGNKIHFIKQSTDGMAPGDAILLESNGHFAMIDTGLGNSKDTTYVYNYLRSVGVTKLDFILLTHIHEDHAAGTINLLNKFPVGRLYTKTYISKGSGDEDYPRYTKIIKQAKAKNVPITYIEKSFTDGKGFDFQSMNIRLYNTKQLKFDDENGNSVLQLIKVNGYRILLTGDLSSYQENKTYIKNLSKKSDFKNLDVLKMPHHGFTSCAFKVNYDAAKNLNPKHIIVTGFSDGCDVVFNSKIPRYYTKNSSKKAIVFTFDNGIKVSK